MSRCGELLFSDPALLAKAQAERAERLRATPYVCPLPGACGRRWGEGGIVEFY